MAAAAARSGGLIVPVPVVWCRRLPRNLRPTAGGDQWTVAGATPATSGGAMVDAAEDAGEKAVDEDRLLEGEDPKTPYLDDATHWVTVYTELLGVKRELVGVSEAHLSDMQEEARREVASTDLVVLDAEMKRFSRRLEFWRQRCLQLGGTPQR
jgi:hypothetical protein